eukprot:7513758-Heterocapsa_arctica.AAC.1
MGLPGLNDKDQKQLNEANELYRRNQVLLAIAILVGCLVSVENPHGSLYWSYPPIERWLAAGVIKRFLVHCCAFGMPWKKATSIA